MMNDRGRRSAGRRRAARRGNAKKASSRRGSPATALLPTAWWAAAVLRKIAQDPENQK